MAFHGENNYVDISDLTALDDVLADYFVEPTLHYNVEYSSDSESDQAEDDELTETILEGYKSKIGDLTTSESVDSSELTAAISQIQEDLEAETATEQSPDISSMKEASGCKCTEFCLSFMTVEQINQNRLNNGSLTKDQLDLLIIGQLRVLIDCGPTTSSTSHKAKARSKTTSIFKVEGKFCLI